MFNVEHLESVNTWNMLKSRFYQILFTLRTSLWLKRSKFMSLIKMFLLSKAATTVHFTFWLKTNDLTFSLLFCKRKPLENAPGTLSWQVEWHVDRKSIGMGRRDRLRLQNSRRLVSFDFENGGARKFAQCLHHLLLYYW